MDHTVRPQEAQVFPPLSESAATESSGNGRTACPDTAVAEEPRDFHVRMAKQPHSVLRCRTYLFLSLCTRSPAAFSIAPFILIRSLAFP